MPWVQYRLSTNGLVLKFKYIHHIAKRYRATGLVTDSICVIGHQLRIYYSEVQFCKILFNFSNVAHHSCSRRVTKDATWAKMNLLVIQNHGDRCALCFMFKTDLSRTGK